MWNLSGPIAAYSPITPHLDLMMQFDRLLLFGRDPVSVVQLNLAGPQVGWLDIVTGILYNMHLGEPYIAGYFLWRLNRAVYLQFITSVLILLVVGFITFILFPAIPPWMASADYGKVQGVQNLFGRVLRWHPMPFHGTPIFYFFQFRGDAVAAMPSEHAAFPFLEFLAFYQVNRRAAGLLALWVVAVLFTVLYLGMHWAVDALAGWLYALLIFAFVRWFACRSSNQGTSLAFVSGSTLHKETT
jgi:membrane-associated phospholipid phosphatase